MKTNIQSDIREVLSKFNVETTIEDYGNGHINDTYLCESSPKYILQKINTNVFKNPDDVMENIFNVTEHITSKIIAEGGNPERETLVFMTTVDNKPYYRHTDGTCFRMYKYVENAISYDEAEDVKILCHAGAAFGKFQRMLDDFPTGKLHETIADFHNTPVRVNQLNDAIKNNLANRVGDVKNEIDFAMDFSKYRDVIITAIKSGEVPIRVTHNDTKLNNVLFDQKSGDAICVIDLDTVMPGSLLYDFGDALRFGASSCAEDETDQSKIWFDLEKFEQFVKGFVGEVKDCLTQKEIELMPISALVMTYECGIRFFADYLNGDTYFKIRRENQNLDRAKNQFMLAKDIESKLDIMAEIISKYI